ncbi:MAG: AsmA-like C-terminal region-containing protein [Bacteroidales bacterium]|nr:AsmA-like C-terminal region-containing protein [Bacteroidales bacterium]
MNKGVKIVLSVLCAIILIMAIAPFLFKGKIEALVKEQANGMLNAVVDFKSVDLSFFRSFPNASIGINDIVVVGKNEFENDTLIASKNIRATVNVMSVISGGSISIKEVSLEKPFVQALINKDGKANWNIMISDSTPADEDDNTESQFSVKLEEFKISDGTIIYDDQQSKMSTLLNGINVSLSGNMNADQTTIKTHTIIEKINFIMGAVPYLSNASFDADMQIAADLKNSKYSFEKNKFILNDIELSLDGWVAMPDTTTTEMDIKLNTSKVEFKNLLSLVPALYQKDFKDIKTDGVVSMNAFVKGVMKGNSYPAFDAKLEVKNGMFKYPDLPESVSNIQINAFASSKGGSLDNAVAGFDNFSFLLGGNPFSMSATASDFMNNLKFAASALGKIDLTKIQNVYPLEDGVKMQGIITADASVSGSMKEIENEQYENINAKGDVVVENISLTQKDSSSIAVSKAKMSFTPKYVELAEFVASMGKNDVSMNGRLENFIPYVLKNETIKGNLNVSSNYICADDFMSDTTSQSSVDTTSAGVIMIPKNIDFNMDVNMKRIDFGKITMNDVVGKLVVVDGIAKLNGLNFNALDGKISANGSYDTSDEKNPKVDMDFGVKEASFAKSFTSVETLSKLAPIFESMKGNYSMNFKLKTDLLSDFTPNLSSIIASGLLQSNDVSIEGVEALDKLAETLKYDALKKISPKNLNLPFEINEGKISLSPFTLNMGSTSMTLNGIAGLDQSLACEGTVTLPNDGVKALGINVKNLPFKLSGTFSSPKISLDTKNLASSVIDNLVSEKLGGNSVKESADSIISEKTNEALIKAQESADKLIKQAQEKADKLVEAAGDNALKKLAAKKAGDALVNEAKKQANALIDKAKKETEK